VGSDADLVVYDPRRSTRSARRPTTWTSTTRATRAARSAAVGHRPLARLGHRPGRRVPQGRKGAREVPHALRPPTYTAPDSAEGKRRRESARPDEAGTWTATSGRHRPAQHDPPRP
jgi:hypothetical protein